MASKNSNNSQPAPLYEDVQPSFPGLAKDQERDFKQKENVACGPGSTIDNLNSDRNDCDMYTTIIVLIRKLRMLTSNHYK